MLTSHEALDSVLAKLSAEQILAYEELVEFWITYRVPNQGL